MPTIERRLHAVLDRLATGTSVARVREYDQQRAIRNGEGTSILSPEQRLELAVEQFEAAADELWKALTAAS